MKYKVVLYNGGGSADVDISANFTFYTFNQAHECCQQWVAISSTWGARLWDGSTWRSYGV